MYNIDLIKQSGNVMNKKSSIEWKSKKQREVEQSGKVSNRKKQNRVEM